MSYYQLAVNTSQNDAQIIILQDRTLVGEKIWCKAKSHSEVITSNFELLLKELNINFSQFNRIYCVNGPGSFTGIRVGVNFCKALAFSLSCPMVAINTLDLLALNCEHTDANLISCIDAQKNCLFVSEFKYQNNQWQRLHKNAVLKVLSLTTNLKQKTYVCGNGIEKYSSFIDANILKNLETKSLWQQCDLKKYFTSHHFPFREEEVPWFDFQPLYLKASAAEEKLNPSEA